MRVLVVEDEQKIAQLIKRGLTLEAFAVDICGTGDEALRLVEENSYQVIILDRRLPGSFEGTELCKELRTLNNSTPILLLTARSKTQDTIDGLNSGADDYMTKPFDFDELVARVRALSRRAADAHPVVLTYDELILDMPKKTVTRDGKPVFLTAKELSLLEYFMQHPGQILSKEAIIGRIWDYDAVVIANNVEVHIRALRRKIDRPFQYPLIHTVKGLGYKLERP